MGSSEGEIGGGLVWTGPCGRVGSGIGRERSSTYERARGGLEQTVERDV